MKKIAVVLVAVVLLAMAAPAAFAQEAGAKPGGGHVGTLAIAAGFAMALAAFGGALGQSRVGAAACEGMARNPGASGAIRASMILGLVFIETLSLLTFVIAIVLYLKM
ncbi:MAG TPA: ATP synthase F0 subunit C [Candidatus Limnocylindrales bacterium]|nr:ATP synthase F0 subunit C [Candidatus Limnocylindrales bacterium]